MTELSFLIELLLNHKLPKATKDAIAERIKEVEAATPVKSQGSLEMGVHGSMTYTPPKPTFSVRAPQEHYVAPAQIAQTPAAAAALHSRELAISQALSGTAEKGRTSPRKF